MEVLHRDQLKNLFQYLREFTQLKYKPKRTTQGFSVLWLHHLPQSSLIHNAARLKPNEVKEQWLVLQKAPLSQAPPPPLPQRLEGWVSGPFNNPHMPPLIRDRIVHKEIVLAADLKAKQIQNDLLLEEEQDIQKSWEEFEQVWHAWADEQLRLVEAQKYYSQLFDFYQKLSTFGERYELRLGLGYLTWKTPAGAEVGRHLLTVNVNLHFDAGQGVLSMTVAGDGAKTTLEQDMLDAQDRVSPEVVAQLQEYLQAQGDQIWAGDVLRQILSTWINAVSNRGLYSNSIEPPKRLTDAPIVHWAPALILRERNKRSLVATYDTILGQIDNVEDVPHSLQRFVGCYEPKAVQQAEAADSTIYFPLPANEDQQKIISHLRHEDGAVVQGPPGTGKSHTIVNLVSHLLATDQKVLVTSHTARALQVLREKFPPELAELCITHLQGEEGAQVALQSSVQEILLRSSRRQKELELELEDELSNKLKTAKQEEMNLLDELQQIRQAETGELNLLGYQGTAQRIGKQLRAQEGDFEWINEWVDANTGQSLSLTNKEATRLLKLWRDISDEEQKELGLRRPKLDILASVEQFVHFVKAEEETFEIAATREQYQSHPAYEVLMAAGHTERKVLLESVTKLIAAIETERRRAIPWIEEALDSLLQGQMSRWQEVSGHSQELLPPLLEEADWLERNEPSGLDDRELNVLFADAKAVYDHLKSGGHWGNFIFKPSAVKNRSYLRETVKIGGRPADSVEVLRDFLKYLDLYIDLQKVKELWHTQGVSVSGPLSMQVNELQEKEHALEKIYKVQPLLEQAQKAIEAITGLHEPKWWETDELSALLDVTKAAQASNEAKDSKEVLEELWPSLQGLVLAGKSHEVVTDLIQSIQSRDIAMYGQSVGIVENLIMRQKLLDERERLFARLVDEQKLLAQELKATFKDKQWDERLAHIESAWKWAQADWRMQELANPDFEVEVRQRLENMRQFQRDTLGQLAASKAWRNTLDRMTHKEQSALVRWEQAIKKLGKGTGVHAERRRLEAQTALEDARSAIPAWIMPVHLVAEHFVPKQGMFDVVIVDEASQAGPEALFLTYIAKKIVIVGDDKQIEPEGIGIQAEQVDALVGMYLKDLVNREVIGHAKASLFDFGNVTYPNRIGLREHFRCMPEIIQFSSDLSYAKEPLIALRQYGMQRLKPLMAQQVFTGQTTENVNKAEAKAIVEQIKACIGLPHYQGKSMGVISLMGDAQAEEIALQLREEISEAEIEERKLVCGNAYSFQGDERDVIFLSMVGSSNKDKGDGGKRKLASLITCDNSTFQSRYNVAVSRARDQLWLFHSLDQKDLKSEDIRSALIQHVRHPQVEGWQPLSAEEIQDVQTCASLSGRAKMHPPRPFENWFEVDVFIDLVRRGYRVIPQYELNRYRIDLVVEGLKSRLAVECDGDQWDGPSKFRADLARQQALERAGMTFWRVRGSTYARDPELALEDLWHTLETRGIYPEGDPRNAIKSKNEPQQPTELKSLSAQAVAQAQEASQEVMADETTNETLPDFPPEVKAKMQPYHVWKSRELPDPRRLPDLAPVVSGLQEIIDQEGPMTCRQAYQTYCRAAGIRMGQAIKTLLNKSMRRALQAGNIVQMDEWGTADLLDKIVRTPKTPQVVFREAGPRQPSDIPPSEISLLMRELLVNDPHLVSKAPETLFQRVLATYGTQNLNGNTRLALEYAYSFLKRSA